MRAALLLAAALAAVAWFAWGDIPWMPRRRALTRIAGFRRWLVKDALGVLMPALVGLALMGRLGAIGRVPAELWPLRALLPIRSIGAEPLLIGGAVGVVLGLALAWRAGRRGRPPFAWGAIDTVLSHSREEVPYGIAMAVMAGVSEELFHRLLTPLLGAIVTGNALASAGTGLILFASMHRYQGWKGMVSTGVVGAMFQALYLLMGSLWPVMLAHVLLDINGLVLRPLAARAGRRYAMRKESAR